VDFKTGVFEIPPHVRDEMRGVSWRDDEACPAFEALRLLKLRHHSFDGASVLGELVVHARVAAEVATIFERLFAAGFPLESLQRIEAFAGDDDASMAANNSSGFNFRKVQGTELLSQHAYGLAIDINPVQNPWLHAGRIDPPGGRVFLDRRQLRPGMIVRPGPVVEAFEAAGWVWGGDVVEAPDLHHFSKPVG
jgi:poly-gamma-glutamate synthesis protein (capsule biosynthesis protein)